jgi:hypothetical protein
MNIVLDTSIISVALTLIVTAFGFMYKFLRDTVKDLSELKKSLEKQIKDGDDKNNLDINSSNTVNDKKLSEVYETFNKYRESIEKNFVSKDVCDVLHKTSSENLTGIEFRLTSNFNRLEEKVEKNFTTFLEQMTKMFQNGNGKLPS